MEKKKMKKINIFKKKKIKKEDELESKKEDEKLRKERFRLDLENRKKLKKEREEYIINAAKDISNNFAYNQIIQAVKSEGIRGIEVYGYLELTYPDTWRDLLSDGIFDKAAFYAQKQFEPEYVFVLKDFDIKKYVKSPVIFREELRFRNFPDRQFRRAVFYAPKPLREYVKWINNYRLYIDGYPSNVVLGKVSLMLLGWALPDYPQILVSFSPSQHQAIFESQISSEDLKNDTKGLLQKIIFYYRKESKVNEMAVLEAQMEKERYEKRWSNLLDKMVIDREDDPRPAGTYDKGNESSLLLKKYNIILYSIIAVLCIGFIISLIFNFI